MRKEEWDILIFAGGQRVLPQHPFLLRYFILIFPEWAHDFTKPFRGIFRASVGTTGKTLYSQRFEVD